MAHDGGPGDRSSSGFGAGSLNRRQFLAAGVTIGVGLTGCAEDGSTPQQGTVSTVAKEPDTSTTTGPETSTMTGPETTTTTSTVTSSPTLTPTYATDPTVVLADESFTPRRLRIQPGETVTWVNEDSTSHTVESTAFNPAIASDWSYYSADIVPGNAMRYTFERAGVYEYFCTVHGQSTMCGVVLVGDVTYDATLPCDA